MFRATNKLLSFRETLQILTRQ